MDGHLAAMTLITIGSELKPVLAAESETTAGVTPQPNPNHFHRVVEQLHLRLLAGALAGCARQLVAAHGTQPVGQDRNHCQQHGDFEN